MAQAKLWTRHIVFHTLILGILSALFTISRADDNEVGMTLLFQSMGRSVVVERFDSDGVRGPVPGSVRGMSPRGGAEMTFMPGDSKRGIPTYVEIAWTIPTESFNAWAQEQEKMQKGGLSQNELAVRHAEFQKRWQMNPHHTKRIDLAPIITSELIAQVRANRKNTQLKLIITFNNDDVLVEAQAYKWR